MSVTIQFCGAAHTVTGSCYLFRTTRARFLVDCGLFQGSKTLKALNYGDFPFKPSDLDVVFLTHAHIDHSGLLPKLVKENFAGRIVATRGTIDLCSYMLPDAGGIHEMEVVTLNRRNLARGRSAVSPIYTKLDATSSLASFQPVEYETWFDAAPGVRARYWNAGHLLGSASIELEISDEAKSGSPLRILMSGDIGPDVKLLQSPPHAPAAFDYVISESTYGNVDRPPTSNVLRRQSLVREISDAAAANGALIIPAFAVERTQELLVDIIDLMERKQVPAGLVFLDSPLAIRATEVFRQHASELDGGVDISRILQSSHLRLSETSDDSKAIEKLSGFHIIISASGMCDAGRIRHHLKNWLWRRNGTVLLVGFQAQGTLGRFLRDGAKAVRILGEEVRVAARIRSIDDYSGHADGPELEQWIAHRRPIRRGLFLVHGEDDALTGLQQRLARNAFPEARIHVPVLDEVYELTGSVPKSIDTPRRRRLTPDAVVKLDWHNDMSKLILDINEKIDDAADDRARGVIIRRLRRALDDEA